MRLRIGVIAAALATAAATVITVAATPASAAAATAAFVQTSNWGSGYEAKYTITNGTSSTINGWTVAFDLPSGTSVSSSWDANRTGTSGRVSFASTWNGTIAPGGTASFGFIAAGSGTPTNCTLNGAACGGGTTPTTPAGTPGVPGNFRVTATTDTSFTLAWNASTGTVTGYRVYEGSTVRATVTGTSTTVSGLTAGST
ncbi:cellulose binding domain-containing protein, partial [Dactylosporangium sp. NPDC000521]|uniref:cellulose binding domain-containing protein n=1 Tax=Dactylosporangium sp. NPDC000521 TaxID=3363975 RepID=UPI00368F0686